MHIEAADGRFFCAHFYFARRSDRRQRRVSFHVKQRKTTGKDENMKREDLKAMNLTDEQGIAHAQSCWRFHHKRIVEILCMLC